MAYEFQGTLYRTESDMLLAIARAWVSADGLNHPDYIRDAFEHTDADLARDCIDGWGLDQPVSEDEDATWLDKRDIDMSDIAAAFADVRVEFENGAFDEPEEEE